MTRTCVAQVVSLACAHHISCVISMCWCCVFDSLRLLHFPLFAVYLLSYRPVFPPGHQLLLPRCGGQIPCALQLMRTLAPLPSTTLSHRSPLSQGTGGRSGHTSVANTFPSVRRCGSLCQTLSEPCRGHSDVFLPQLLLLPCQPLVSASSTCCSGAVFAFSSLCPLAPAGVVGSIVRDVRRQGCWGNVGSLWKGSWTSVSWSGSSGELQRVCPRQGIDGKQPSG